MCARCGDYPALPIYYGDFCTSFCRNRADGPQRWRAQEGWETSHTRLATARSRPEPVWTTREYPCEYCQTIFTQAASYSPRRFCSRPCVTAHNRIARGAPPDGSVKPGSDGYALEALRGRFYAQHRLVMERSIGRSLRKLESVHHINGVRDDNRPENLELWSRSHPSGQRVEDKVAWAREILALYT